MNTVAELRGEVAGICKCKIPRVGKNAYRRTCMKCRRWVGPAYYPDWYGKHPPIKVPIRVVCK